MTTEEMIELKQKTEREIHSLLTTFMEKTGMQITGINFHDVRSWRGGRAVVQDCYAELEVTL